MMNKHDLTTFHGAAEWITENYPQIAKGLSPFSSDESLTELAREVYAMFVAKTEGRYQELQAGIESFVQMSFDFLRLQTRFMRSGCYQAESEHGLLKDLYLDSERMQGYYLDGLLLTYAFWPNHVRLFRYFRDQFLKNIDQHSQVRIFEIGVGHGLMACMLLRHLPNCHYAGIDVSPSSLIYAQRLWEANETGRNDGVLEIANAVNWTPKEGYAGRCDVVICCEVLEHVERPELVLNTIQQLLRDDGTAFISTVANIAAEDHIHLFHNADEIRTLCEKAEFFVVDEQIWPLKGFNVKKSLPINYAAILRRPV